MGIVKNSQIFNSKTELNAAFEKTQLVYSLNSINIMCGY